MKLNRRLFSIRGKYQIERGLFLSLILLFLFSIAVFPLNAEQGFSSPERLRIFTEALSDVTVEDVLKQKVKSVSFYSGDIQKVQSLNTPIGTVHRYQLIINNYPVIGAGMTIVIGKSGNVLSIYNSIPHHLDVPNITPFISEEQAKIIALQHVGNRSLRCDPLSEGLVLFPIEGVCYLTWKVKIASDSPAEDWEVFIDAEMGEIVFAEDRIMKFEGVGLVFNPDPITTTRDTTLRDDDNSPDAVPEEAYFEVELLFLEGDDEEGYSLTGRYADTSPTENRALMETPEFLFARGDDRFEEVMVYFHTTNAAQYLVDLGYENIVPIPQLFNVNAIEEDMSFFSPHTGIITTGRGGVDDAEDAVVIIHEYGHSLLYNILGEWRGREVYVMTEGFCDYIAGDYSLWQDDSFLPMRIFKWDGHNEFWAGRVLDSDLTMNDIADLDPHIAGQVWSSLLTEVRQLSEHRDEWNQVVFAHFWSLGDSASIQDAADALLLSDLLISNGMFRRCLVPAMEKRKIFPSQVYKPLISHIPLNDTEDIYEPRTVEMSVESHFDLDFDKIHLIYRLEDGDADSVLMNHIQDFSFEGEIPPTERESIMYYYISATDTLGLTGRSPQNAPYHWHSYFSGPDMIPPTIVRMDTLPNSVFTDGEINFSAVVLDNIGVESVSLLWYRGWMEFGGIIPLTRDDDDIHRYYGVLKWHTRIDDGILYRLRAEDISARRNISNSDFGYFSIEDRALVDSFESALHRWKLSGWDKSDNYSRFGTWSLLGKGVAGVYEDNEAIAELDEYWYFKNFRRARLMFWDRRYLDAVNGEFAYVDVSSDSGRSWDVLVRFQQSQHWWQQQEVWLDHYSGDDAHPIRIRFRISSPIEVEETDGWYIDYIELIVDGRVDVFSLEEAQTAEHLTIFPNPVNDKLRITYNTKHPAKLCVYDVSGRLFSDFTLDPTKNTEAVDLSSLPNGIYFLRGELSSTSITKKFLILK